ncbi:SDR family NAD(P)-dependent oxidoreductase [Streptococcus moroccensis]|uniref:Short-subunit dehydrogenase n=1 Tax=Streptococcus moroccensis TaxID=1451356 RepID=A0ABT9YR60_9STRE|nr:SDR family oxidoreductase [Streptococcus moroccensis]MDQ0222493.1 short-subunit dehydrogenase [Streptococcus moroccensis]
MRTIIITGATGGLAQEIIKQLPEEQLILTGRSLEKLTALYQNRPRTQLVQLDLTDNAALEQFVVDVYQTYGHIDVLINNAGFGDFKVFDQVTDSEIRAMFDIDVFALMALSRLVGKEMKQQRHGQIINVSSVLGLMATSKSTVYAAAKFAVTGFSNALRFELVDHGVTVTTVNPGPIRTGFFDLADPSGDYLKRVDRYALNPDQVARRIVKTIGTRKGEVTLPFILKAAHRLYTLFPTIGDYLARKAFNYK